MRKKLIIRWVVSTLLWVAILVTLSLGEFVSEDGIATKITLGEWSAISLLLSLFIFLPLIGRTISIVRKEKFKSVIWGEVEIDETLYADAVRITMESGFADISQIQRQLKSSYSITAAMVERMESEGIVEAFSGSSRRNLLPQRKEVETARYLDDFSAYGGIEAEMLTVDLMNGHDFEYYSAEVLRATGFSEVSVTPGSGDQGVDILAEKDGIRYAIQCKCYTSDLGNAPVQEVNAGRAIYQCHVAAVLTNRYFTDGAKKAAEATGVLLWDRDKLKSLIQLAKNL